MIWHFQRESGSTIGSVTVTVQQKQQQEEEERKGEHRRSAAGRFVFVILQSAYHKSIIY
jgi:hypothetical protein